MLFSQYFRKIWAAKRGETARLGLPPGLDLRVVALEEDFRHLHSAELRRLGVLRRFKEPFAAEAL